MSNLSTDEIINLDDTYTMDTYSRHKIAVERGEGCRLFSTDGRKYIDFASGIGVMALGYSYPAWVSAVTAQVSKLAHCSNYFYTEPSARLAKRLCEASGMSKVFFGNSGAEANEGAIKLARKYSSDKYGEGRSTIITLRSSFHGRTVTTLSATGQDVFHKSFAPFTGGFKYIEPSRAALEDALTDDVCAVMVEPIRGEGGVLPLDEDFALSLKKLGERDILLICDEVQTGIGRTGKLFGCELYGLSPDIITLAKALGGGLPIGAFMCVEKLSSVMGASSHGSTFGANPVSCAGANAVLDTVLSDGFLQSVTEKGNYIKKRILAMNIPYIDGIRGAGLMAGIVIGGGKSAKTLAHALTDSGLLALTAGSDAIRFLPPLVITYRDIDDGLEIFEKVMRSCI